MATVRAIEERSLNAWSALRRVFLDGWILGLSEGYTRCANSVNPIYDGIRTVEDRIPLCEETCANHGLATTFKITPMAVEMGLDRALEGLSYTNKATTRVQVLTLGAAQVEADQAAEVLDQVSDDWMADYQRLKQMDAWETAKNRTILDRTGLPTRFVSILESGDRVAAGIAVIESGCFGS
ncbi:TPA: hypothetical protein DCE37_07885 [Candidatus Latescibacteria bacterium]|nr:hypothetical protein [Candidatus Latescibacterota bacterium]